VAAITCSRMDSSGISRSLGRGDRLVDCERLSQAIGIRIVPRTRETQLPKQGAAQLVTSLCGVRPAGRRVQPGTANVAGLRVLVATSLRLLPSTAQMFSQERQRPPPRLFRDRGVVAGPIIAVESVICFVPENLHIRMGGMNPIHVFFRNVRI